MALAVDAGGKVKANPRTGKVIGNAVDNTSDSIGQSIGRSVANALNDIDWNQLVSSRASKQPTKHGQESVANAGQIASQSYQPLPVIPNTSSNVTRSLPSVQTASMSSPIEVKFGESKTQDPMSYWDRVQQQDLETVKALNEHFSNPSSDLDPSFMSGVNIEASDGGYKAGEGDVNRWGENYKDDPVGPVSTSWIGNTRNNDRYEDLFATGFNGETEGMSPYDLETTHGRDWTTMLSSTNTTPNMSEEIDDGTMDYEHLTSPKISGAQLKRYARNGMAPGLTIDQIEQINPDKVYDKGQLAADPDVGFMPYVPDIRTYTDMSLDYPTDVVSRMSGELANLRGNISSVMNPYRINYNDGTETRQINGPLFDNGAYDYLASVYRDRQDNPRRFFDDSHKNGGSWSQYAAQWRTVNPSGETEYHYGFPTTPYESNNDGTSDLVFDDGSRVPVSDAWLASIYDIESNNYVIPMDGNTWVIETPDGGTKRMTGGINDVVSNMDGTSSVGFSDGTTATMSDSYIDTLERNDNGWPMMEYGGMANVTDLGLTLNTAQLNGTDFPDRYVDENGVETDQLNNPDVASYWMPNYVMDDGTVLPYYDALAIAGDTNGRETNENLRSGQSVDYEFGPMIKYLPNLPFGLGLTNTPARLQSEPLGVENGSLDLSNLLSNGADRVFDWTMGSLPIMIPQTQWPVSMSNMMQSARGAASNRYDPYGNSYGFVSAERGDDGMLRNDNGDGVIDPRLTSSIMAGAVPVTEDMVGPIGDVGSGGSILRDMFEGPGLRNALARWGLGLNSEGWEEVAGNFFEGLGDYSVPNAFGNYLDENGNVVATEEEAATDERGLPVRESWSSLADRAYNFGIPMYRDGRIQIQPDALANNINSYIGGAAISALPGAMEEYGNMRDYDEQLAYLNSLGLNDFYQNPERVRERHAPEGYLEQWR